MNGRVVLNTSKPNNSHVPTPGPDQAVSNREILLFFVETPDPAFTAKEVAKEFEKTRQWADNLLEDLTDSGLLKSKNPGGGSKFYWITEDGKYYLAKTRD